MKITFLGATGQVTGSNYLLEHKGTKILIDCGLFQSGFFNDQKNYEPFHFKPSEINAVILTHAHIDHSGRVPVLAKYGFKGKVYATPPTLDFARILLLDSLGVLEKEAIHFGHDLIYNEKDVKNVVELFENVA